ncbi:hypothetical protein DFH27DRAFT_522564 [Peziza echinospora]|nr:hypothetical protein DFH27DRAFT_522564 [Peziza echinospora]
MYVAMSFRGSLGIPSTRTKTRLNFIRNIRFHLATRPKLFSGTFEPGGQEHHQNPEVERGPEQDPIFSLRYETKLSPPPPPPQNSTSKTQFVRPSPTFLPTVISILTNDRSFFSKLQFIHMSIRQQTDGLGMLVLGTSPRPTHGLAGDDRVTVGDSVFGSAASFIQEDQRIYFTTIRQLRKQLKGIVRQMDKTKAQKTPGDEVVMKTHRILVQGVSDLAIFDEAIATLPFRRNLRVWYEAPSAIITILPGIAHEIVSWRLYTEILLKVIAIPGHNASSVHGVGSARFRAAGGRRSKEGDAGVRCATRQGEEWPNIMIEVGYSEPLSQLRMDATWWLLNSSGKTKLVIIALISTGPKKLHIEIWEERPNPNPRTRHAPPTVPQQVNMIDIDQAGLVSPPSGTITIPYNLLFDDQHPSATDITISTAELRELALLIFAQI